MSTRKKFPGFSRHMPTFFRALEKNNDRAWFAPRKPLFEQEIRTPMIALVTQLNDRLRTLSPDHVAEDPARLLYRIYRDTRFSKDKTPYKSHLGATFPHRTLSRHGGAGFYFEISHRYVGIAGGIYMPGPDELSALRNAIAANPKRFLALVENPKRQKIFGPMQGERLTRLPKPLQAHAQSPATEYLKFKQFYWWLELPAKEALSPRLPTLLIRHFEALTEPLAWFNQTLLTARRNEEDQARPTRPAPMW